MSSIIGDYCNTMSRRNENLRSRLSSIEAKRRKNFRSCGLVKKGRKNYSIALHGALAMEISITPKESAGRQVAPYYGRLVLEEGKSNTQVASRRTTMKSGLKYFSFVDALEKMSSYVKFFKDILAKKRRMNDFEIVALTQVTNDFFKNGVLEKITDPGSFTVSCRQDGS
ncbi:uncharacterized protein E6C27_scaffold379G00780 [Cucumis melo var. makuwa]|uniref:Uncharacterized protein n=1 Tax=Cucumis melo var. makuwa TaxID=1194695 RepID=A0A5A7T6I1_CUCMM|nr:uncharacterized protein E6C27_scaffold379G00780 [Cucumis melo var. makuwa]